MLTKYRGTRLNYKSQSFGDNFACARVDKWGQMIRPAQIKGKGFSPVCEVGYKDFYRLIGMKGHNGNDWTLPMKTPIYHYWNFTGWMRHDDDFDGGLGADIVSQEELLTCNEGCPVGTKHYVKSRNWHLHSRSVPEKTVVQFGDLTCLSGNSGASSGPHLHESLKWCDKAGSGLHTDNGYYGAIDIAKHPEIQVKENICVIDYEDIVEINQTLIETLKVLIFVMGRYINSLTKN